MTGIDALTWPYARAGEALHALAAHAGFAPDAVQPVPPGRAVDEPEVFAHWIDAVARHAGVGVEPVEATYGDVDRLLRHGPPVVVRLATRGVLAIARAHGGELLVLGPDGVLHATASAAVRTAIVDELERPVRNDVDALLDTIGVPPARRMSARDAMLTERLASSPVGQAWLVRLADGASVVRRFKASRIPARLAALVGTHVVEYTLWILAWVFLGRGVLDGRLDPGWLIAWLLLLVSIVPLRAFETWLAGIVAVQCGGLIRRRLLAGALRLEPEELRHDGIGRLLGRVLEADAFDGLAVSGGLTTLTAAVELAIVFAILVVAGAWLLATALLGWLVVIGVLTQSYVAQRRQWATSRRSMTHELVEGMVGHRTRQAQEAPDRKHESEDHALQEYVGFSKRMDRTRIRLESAASRGWVIVALGAFAPAFVGGLSSAGVAVAIGAVLLASRAVRRVAGGLAEIAGAAVAWEQIAPLFHAAARREVEGTVLAYAVATASTSRDGRPLLEAQHLTFRHAGREVPALRNCSLQIRTGDRILIQGPSGSGKSTFASLLVGLRAPQQGLLLLDGLDRPSLGAWAWRRRVVAAPQFHENHVFSGTFLFNALMGADVWPPRREDLEAVETICRELGLGELLDRMPAGVFQMVGDTGWQLSHGERSRLYIARTLLQGAEMVVLDESFAALDPETLEQALRCVLARAKTLVVIAHP